MHHILRFYSIHQELVLRLYMFSANFTKLPVIGKYIMILMNRYALTKHGAYILTAEEAKSVIDAATDISLGECKCRKVFSNCDSPIMTDIVIGIGHDIFTRAKKAEYLSINKAEARKIIDDSSKRGLVQSIIRCGGEVYALCNCCPCCCVPFRLSKDYGIKDCWSRDKNIVNDLIITLKHNEV